MHQSFAIIPSRAGHGEANVQLFIWFKQYLFETISHIQYIIFYDTGFDKKLLAYKHHLLDI